MKNFGLWLFFGLVVLAFSGCRSYHPYVPPPPLPDDRLNVPAPASRDIPVYQEYVDKMTWRRLDYAIDIVRQTRRVTDNRKEAFNVDAFDEVANSSWFTNRNSAVPLTLTEIARGPNQNEGPDGTNPWTIKSAKTQGVTPGFRIKDARGDNYFIKFDPVSFPEMASGAEVVSTKLFYAAGYNTPENFIVTFDPAILRLSDGVTFTDNDGQKRLMTTADIEAIMKRVNHLPDGRIRAMASRFLPGKPMGPFTYQGLREDDFNDFIPHEHRRELRGLRLISAWLNHFDTKDGNTLDMYVTEDERRFVKHFLIDFGATLGSASLDPNDPWRGFRYDYDPVAMTWEIGKLGLFVEKWRHFPKVIHPSVGFWEADEFQPENYYPQVANPAFQNLTDRDGFWAARIVMSFTDEQLAAAVKTGQYSDPAAEKYILDTLIKRRDKIGRYYFSRVNPLADFSMVENQLCFTDWAVASGLETFDQTKYRFSLYCENKPIIEDREFGPQPGLDLSEWTTDIITSDKQWRIILETRREDKQSWSPPLTIYLEFDSETRQIALIGLER